MLLISTKVFERREVSLMNEVGFNEFLDRSRPRRILLLEPGVLFPSNGVTGSVWVGGELMIDLTGYSGSTEVVLKEGSLEEVGNVVVVGLSSAFAFPFGRGEREGSGGGRG